jgi:uncharacterized protein (DUF885 family)
MSSRSKSRSKPTTFLLGALVAIAFFGCVTPPPPATARPPTGADQTFERIATRYLDDMVALTPVNATLLGEHRFDGQLDDVGPTARDRRVQLARSLLGQLGSLDRTQLSRANQVDAALLGQSLEYTLWQLTQLEDWSWDPLLYTGIAGNGIYLLMARDFAPLPVRLNDAAGRLEALPRFLTQVRDSLDPARVPRIHAETAIKQNGGILTLIDELIVPNLDALPPADRSRLKSAIERARTAVAQQQIWLEKRLLPEAKGEFRLGAERYDGKLRFELAASLSRQEIRARAEAALARTRVEMYTIARDVLRDRPDAPNLPDTPTAEEQQAAIAAALALAAADQPARTEVLAAARQAFTDADSFVRTKDLVTLHADPLDIVPMPQFQRGVALAYCDAPGPLDKGQKTFFSVAPIPSEWTEEQVHSYLREYNRRAIDELTIHEAMPGHYVQLDHANRYDSPLRAVLQSGTFVEGWAEYAEQMMSEQGYRDGDPLMRLVHLKWNLRAISNAVLDQAVHVDGMSREAAMQLMVHDAFEEEREAAAKWTRVQLSAVQLSTYFVGFEEHLALRDEARQRWGATFTLKRYHDAVLSFGSPPVKYVRELMFDLPITGD